MSSRKKEIVFDVVVVATKKDWILSKESWTSLWIVRETRNLELKQRLQVKTMMISYCCYLWISSFISHVSCFHRREESIVLREGFVRMLLLQLHLLSGSYASPCVSRTRIPAFPWFHISCLRLRSCMITLRFHISLTKVVEVIVGGGGVSLLNFRWISMKVREESLRVENSFGEVITIVVIWLFLGFVGKLDSLLLLLRISREELNNYACLPGKYLLLNRNFSRMKSSHLNGFSYLLNCG